PHSMGISGVVGISGESGSAISKIRNDDFYTIYGVLSFSAGLSHTKINRARYFAIEDIIVDDLVLSIPKANIYFSIYPNPSNGVIWIKNGDEINLTAIKVYDAIGQKVLSYSIGNYSKQLVDLSQLNSGIYLLELQTSNGFYTQRIIKN
ncbi:MAG: T9SS type A sorting domain-containing protein, partial [Chitinophagales bacterium]